MIPPAPEGLSSYGKRKWREDQLQKLMGPATTAPMMSIPQPVNSLRAGPSAKERGKAVGVSWFARRRGPFFPRFLFPKCGSMFGGMLCMCLGIAVLLSGHQGPVMQVARIIGAAADLSEHTTGVAVQALNATTQLASGATELFLSVASSGLSSGANLWHGVDLTGLYARRCAGQLLVDGDSTLEMWLNSQQALILIPCLEPPLQRQLLAASQTVGMTMPRAQTSTEELELDGTYRAVRIWGSLHGSGQIQLQFDFVQVDFTPRWANPVWQQWQVPLDGEREQIMRLLRQTVVQLPAPPIHAGQAVLEIQPEIGPMYVIAS